MKFLTKIKSVRITTVSIRKTRWQSLLPYCARTIYRFLRISEQVKAKMKMPGSLISPPLTAITRPSTIGLPTVVFSLSRQKLQPSSAVESPFPSPRCHSPSLQLSYLRWPLFLDEKRQKSWLYSFFNALISSEILNAWNSLFEDRQHWRWQITE